MNNGDDGIFGTFQTTGGGQDVAFTWDDAPKETFSTGDSRDFSEVLVTMDGTTGELTLGEKFAAMIDRHVSERICVLVDCLIADAEEAALARAVLLGVEDANLVYADWLEEKGQTERAWRVRTARRSMKG